MTMPSSMAMARLKHSYAERSGLFYYHNHFPSKLSHRSTRFTLLLAFKDITRPRLSPSSFHRRHRVYITCGERASNCDKAS